MMIILGMVLLGLCFGSFINALVWRIHEQKKASHKRQQSSKSKPGRDLSILQGRSMCVRCGHKLAWPDLIPVLSWLSLRGRCRYCHEPIAWQYPLVEVTTAVMFVISYLAWPYDFSVVGSLRFVLWLVLLVGLIALTVYDLRWMLLPNRIVYPLTGLVLLQVILLAAAEGPVLGTIIGAALGLFCCGGIFYVLFQLSNGRWIGGGDVKLGFLLGLLVSDPVLSLLVLFLASSLGTLVILPLLLSRRISRQNHVPFGPFLIAAGIIVYLFGSLIIDWYTRQFLGSI